MNKQTKTVSDLEFSKRYKSERTAQTIIEGNKILIRENDEMKFTFFKLNSSDVKPITADFFLNDQLVEHMSYEKAQELISEFTNETSDRV